MDITVGFLEGALPSTLDEGDKAFGMDAGVGAADLAEHELHIRLQIRDHTCRRIQVLGLD